MKKTARFFLNFFFFWKYRNETCHVKVHECNHKVQFNLIHRHNRGGGETISKIPIRLHTKFIAFLTPINRCSKSSSVGKIVANFMKRKWLRVHRKVKFLFFLIPSHPQLSKNNCAAEKYCTTHQENGVKCVFVNKWRTKKFAKKELDGQKNRKAKVWVELVSSELTKSVLVATRYGGGIQRRN